MYRSVIMHMVAVILILVLHLVSGAAEEDQTVDHGTNGARMLLGKPVKPKRKSTPAAGKPKRKSTPKLEHTWLEIGSCLDRTATTARKLLEQLGEGGEGVVCTGTYDSQPVVIKKMKNHKNDPLLEDEFHIQKAAYSRSRSPSHVIEPLALVQQDGRTNLVMRKVDGVVDLLDYSRRSSIPQPVNTRVCSILRQIGLETLIPMHRHGIYHRDIKPENILVHANQGALDLFLIDFGLAVSTTPNIGWNYDVSIGHGIFDYKYPRDYTVDTKTKFTLLDWVMLMTTSLEVYLRGTGKLHLLLLPGPYSPLSYNSGWDAIYDSYNNRDTWGWDQLFAGSPWDQKYKRFLKVCLPKASNIVNEIQELCEGVPNQFHA